MGSLSRLTSQKVSWCHRCHTWILLHVRHKSNGPNDLAARSPWVSTSFSWARCHAIKLPRPLFVRDLRGQDCWPVANINMAYPYFPSIDDMRGTAIIEAVIQDLRTVLQQVSEAQPRSLRGSLLPPDIIPPYHGLSFGLVKGTQVHYQHENSDGIQQRRSCTYYNPAIIPVLSPMADGTRKFEWL